MPIASHNPTPKGQHRSYRPPATRSGIDPAVIWTFGKSKTWQVQISIFIIKGCNARWAWFNFGSNSTVFHARAIAFSSPEVSSYYDAVVQNGHRCHWTNPIRISHAQLHQRASLTTLRMGEDHSGPTVIITIQHQSPYILEKEKYLLTSIIRPFSISVKKLKRLVNEVLLSRVYTESGTKFRVMRRAMYLP